MSILFVAIGGFFGAIARYGTSLLFLRLKKSGHLATMCVNLLGAFLIGMAAHAAWQNPHWQLLAVTGFLGAFTTFSTFMLDTVSMIENGKRMSPFLYVMGTLIGGILLFIAGWKM